MQQRSMCRRESRYDTVYAEEGERVFIRTYDPYVLKLCINQDAIYVIPLPKRLITTCSTVCDLALKQVRVNHGSVDDVSTAISKLNF